MEKMEVYKKISAISSRDELDRIHSELEDRFGPLTDEVSSIFAIAEIRIICKKLFVSSLQEKEGMVVVDFSRLSHLSMEKVLRLIRESGGKVVLNAEKPNCLYIKSGKIDLKDKAEFLSERLSMLL
ncbi:Transcription-repair-coupling factor [subsurface metagenome]